MIASRRVLADAPRVSPSPSIHPSEREKDVEEPSNRRRTSKRQKTKDKNSTVASSDEDEDAEIHNKSRLRNREKLDSKESSKSSLPSKSGRGKSSSSRHARHRESKTEVSGKIKENGKERMSSTAGSPRKRHLPVTMLDSDSDTSETSVVVVQRKSLRIKQGTETAVHKKMYRVKRSR